MTIRDLLDSYVQYIHNILTVVVHIDMILHMLHLLDSYIQSSHIVKFKKSYNIQRIHIVKLTK